MPLYKRNIYQANISFTRWSNWLKFWKHFELWNNVWPAERTAMTSEIMMKFSRGYDILPTKLSSLHCYRVLTQWIWSRKSPISRYVYQSLLSLICTIRTCVKLSCPYFNIFRNSPYEVLYLYEITAKFSWKWQDCENIFYI